MSQDSDLDHGYSYPFSSKLKDDISTDSSRYYAWQAKGFDLNKTLSSLSGQLIELGGPSLEGFYYLSGHHLPQPLLITNLSYQAWADRAKAKQAKPYIKQLVDATDLPWQDNSLGLVAAHYISVLKDSQPHDKSAHHSAAWRAAETELSQLWLGQLKPTETSLGQLPKMWLEVIRTLRPGGIFITDGPLHHLDILERLGFIPKALLISGDFIEEMILLKQN